MSASYLHDAKASVPIYLVSKEILRRGRLAFEDAGRVCDAHVCSFYCGLGGGLVSVEAEES